MKNETATTAETNVIGLPEINIEDIKKELEGIDSDSLKKMRDGNRVTDSAISIVLWERQKGGEKVFSDTEYDADERIQHYTERGNKYVKRSVNHGVSIILGLLSKFLPDGIINLIKVIFKI